jgi:hypothetical protein
MIYKHYGELVRPKNAARYWQLKPSPPKEEKVVPIERTLGELKEFLRTAQRVKKKSRFLSMWSHHKKRLAATTLSRAYHEDKPIELPLS